MIDFLNNSSEAEKKIAIPLIAGTRLRSITTSNTLRKIFLAHYDFPDWLYQESYSAVGDTSELISLLIESHNKAQKAMRSETKGTNHIPHPSRAASIESATSSSRPASIERATSSSPPDSIEGAPPSNSAPVTNHLPLSSNSSRTGDTFSSGRAFSCWQTNDFAVEFEEGELDPINWLETTLLMSKNKVPQEILEKYIVTYWREHNSQDIFIFNKLLVGNLRIGVSRGLFAKALALWSDVSNSAAQQFLTRNNIGSTSIISQLRSSTSDDTTFPFCLAYPWADSKNETESHFLVEAKFDGIRAQITTGNGAQIWSRGELDVSSTFPEILRTFQRIKSGFTVDGEIVASLDGKILDFNTLQSRLGRKKITPSIMSEFPVSFIAYDILRANGQDIRVLPLEQRKAYLSNFTSEFGIYESPYSLDFKATDISFLKEHARELKIEGLMYKNKDSQYESGRKKGVWYKDKIEPLALDAVLVYAQVGTGKRANLFTDYTFALKDNEKLVTFAKAYSGLDDSEIEKLDRWIRRHTLDKKGPVRILSPELVFEISFEGISQSNRHKSGIAVRFPRIKRWRFDKTVDEINTLQDALALLNSQISSHGELSRTTNPARENQAIFESNILGVLSKDSPKPGGSISSDVAKSSSFDSGSENSSASELTSHPDLGFKNNQHADSSSRSGLQPTVDANSSSEPKAHSTPDKSCISSSDVDGHSVLNRLVLEPNTEVQNRAPSDFVQQILNLQLNSYLSKNL